MKNRLFLILLASVLVLVGFDALMARLGLTMSGISILSYSFSWLSLFLAASTGIAGMMFVCKDDPEEVCTFCQTVRELGYTIRVFDANRFPEGFKSMIAKNPQKVWEEYAYAWQTRPHLFKGMSKTEMEKLAAQMG